MCLFECALMNTLLQTNDDSIDLAWYKVSFLKKLFRLSQQVNLKTDMK